MTFRRYWPWWVAFGWLVVYELVALYRQEVLGQHDWRTLSQLATNASMGWWPLPLVAVGLIVVLVVHFWGGKWWRQRRGRS